MSRETEPRSEAGPREKPDPRDEPGARVEPGPGRRGAVLDAAMTTFARFGYRKTSMAEVARAADISRPGLYFLFSSKELLFRAAVEQLLERDLAAVERVLTDTRRPLAERLATAFDQWAGRYTEPPARDIPQVVEAHPGLLGECAERAPRRFEELVTAALAERPEAAGQDPTGIARTLISTSVGLKHQAPSHAFYTERLALAIRLLVR
ncbi:transcriptional regulator, TetR family [Streptomyces sp. TverLS-915]|nr:TetR/AcrR family transcriptional regulator [Streptomyces sp. TverLS-915]SCE01024.1 transcriptional regulator, TetR family [Streptomyces sp. TverLS-915]